MVGIDIIEIARFKDITTATFSHWEKVFNASEWEYCFKKPLPAQHLAGIFAAKEAVIKAFGGLEIVQYTMVDITHDLTGKPLAVVTGRGGYRVSISISHNETMAAAIALVEGTAT